jgi:serine/threonine protein phosphatase PrpC
MFILLSPCVTNAPCSQLIIFHLASKQVSVRALRGGRLSMEDEFIVAAGGRMAAVFDGHGGGGVSQYLRDHLHLVVAEHLDHQEKNQK